MERRLPRSDQARLRIPAGTRDDPLTEENDGVTVMHRFLANTEHALPYPLVLQGAVTELVQAENERLALHALCDTIQHLAYVTEAMLISTGMTQAQAKRLLRRVREYVLRLAAL